MKLSTIIDDAQDDFIRHQLSTCDQQEVFQKYAAEELQLPQEQTEQYAQLAVGDFENRIQELSGGNLDNFYYWYYFNYMLSQAKYSDLIEYNIAIHDMPQQPFYDLRCYPVRAVAGKVPALENCLPEEAHFWEIYLCQDKSVETCIADCADHETAHRLMTQLTNLLKFYREI